MSHPQHDPNSEIAHLADELLHSNTEKEKLILEENKKNRKTAGKLSFAYGFLVGASILSALIIGGTQIYTHYKDVKIEEYQWNMKWLEKKIHEQQERQKLLNIAITQLRLVFIKAEYYCKKKPIPEQKKDELEEKRLDAVAGLIELHFDMERLFGLAILQELSDFTQKVSKKPLCDSASSSNELRLSHVQISEDTQKVIDKNIIKLQKIKSSF